MDEDATCSVDIVLDGDPAPPPLKGGRAHNFGPCLLRLNGCMDQDETWHGDRPRPRPHCVRWGPTSPPQKGHSPSFWPVSVVAEPLDG